MTGLPVAEILFRLGQINAGSVSAFKSRNAHLHLFAFELAGDSKNRDDHIRILSRIHRLWSRAKIDLRPDQFRDRLAILIR